MGCESSVEQKEHLPQPPQHLQTKLDRPRSAAAPKGALGGKSVGDGRSHVRHDETVIKAKNSRKAETGFDAGQGQHIQRAPDGAGGGVTP
jgi:hypothetical protein